jgi:hypothetical protein
VVAGVLSEGSATCLGTDTYVRLDAIRGWLQSVVGPPLASDLQCGAITEEGRCLEGLALQCSGTTLDARTCVGGTVCGWDRDRSAVGCVDPAADPCDGADALGACRDNAALRCSAGVLERRECSPCGVCRLDGMTGAPQCVAGSDAG